MPRRTSVSTTAGGRIVACGIRIENPRAAARCRAARYEAVRLPARALASSDSYGFTATALVSGLIWAVWHYPILLSTDYGEGGPQWYLLLCFTASVIGISFAAAWLRLRTGSVWPAVLLHASHNLFVLNVFAPLVVQQRTTFLLTGEGGLLMAVVGVSLAVVFWRLRSRLEDAGSRAPDADEPPVSASARGGRPHSALATHGLKTGDRKGESRRAAVAHPRACCHALATPDGVLSTGM
ncbi:MAG: CPBP family intramembrane metalloprotease [Chloroflexota bacterium]|nr:CPBP family intramembrane metalloprotease [Chloroflexota bacterium]